jgi:hypothetical protein
MDETDDTQMITVHADLFVKCIGLMTFARLTSYFK